MHNLPLYSLKQTAQNLLEPTNLISKGKTLKKDEGERKGLGTKSRKGPGRSPLISKDEEEKVERDTSADDLIFAPSNQSIERQFPRQLSSSYFIRADVYYVNTLSASRSLF